MHADTQGAIFCLVWYEWFRQHWTFVPRQNKKIRSTASSMSDLSLH